MNGLKETQLLKGVLDGCVVAIIAEKESYGYELMQVLKEKGFTNIVGGTLYPLLQKLEKKNYIAGTIKESPDGPDRRYFSITEEGKVYLADFKDQWNQLVLKVEEVLGEEDG